MHGQGIFVWEDGKKYTGEYWHGLKYGHGKLELLDGTVYEGEWKNGKQDGEGTLLFNNNGNEDTKRVQMEFGKVIDG